jgi:hypothetical protein
MREVLEKLDFDNTISKLDEGGLFQVLQKFRNVDLHPDKIDNPTMGTIFEEPIRKFNEALNENPRETSFDGAPTSTLSVSSQAYASRAACRSAVAVQVELLPIGSTRKGPRALEEPGQILFRPSARELIQVRVYGLAAAHAQGATEHVEDRGVQAAGFARRQRSELGLELGLDASKGEVLHVVIPLWVRIVMSSGLAAGRALE